MNVTRSPPRGAVGLAIARLLLTAMVVVEDWIKLRDYDAAAA